MIITITGLPGNGKTLYALNWVKAKAEKEGRQVYYSGIADLALPWTEIEPTKWMEAPPNSIVVIDECQRVFRPRMHGTAVPAYVSELETHRHKGIDIVLITQHPMLIDSNVRRLCGLHFHCVRKFGLNASTIHEWNSIKENCDKNRDDSTRHDFKFPKASFGWYKSAEVHTHKARIPARVILLAVVLIALLVLGWRIYARLQDRTSGEGAAEQGAPASAPTRTVPDALPANNGQVKLTRAEWLEEQRPRVEGLAYTAPAYDEVTKPVRAPYPAACIQAASKGCRCYSQQGTRLEVPDLLCRSISERGFFIAWDENRQGQSMQGRAAPQPVDGARVAQGAPIPLSPDHRARDPVRPNEPRGLATIGANVAQASDADGAMLSWMRSR